MVGAVRFVATPSASRRQRSRVALPIFASLIAILATGCAHDVVLKPAASSFATDATSALTDVSRRYDSVIGDLNELNVRFLADNPSCGLNTRVRLRTAKADELLSRLGAPATSDPKDACLTDGEWGLIDDYLDKHRDVSDADIAPERRLTILSRSDFDIQLATVKTLTDYVKILADASDAPNATVARDIKGFSNGLTALGGGAGKLQEAMSRGKDTGLSTLFADKGPVSSFAGHLADLGGAIELIADQAKDSNTLRKAIAGPTGQRVPEYLDALASDADAWSCIRYQARLGQMDEDSQRLSAQLPKLSRDQRLAIARDYLQKMSAVPEAQCGAVRDGTKVSPIGQMLAALKDAHLDLARIADGKLTASERSREAAATMERLGAVFKSIAGAALVIL